MATDLPLLDNEFTPEEHEANDLPLLNYYEFTPEEHEVARNLILFHISLGLPFAWGRRRRELLYGRPRLTKPSRSSNNKPSMDKESQHSEAMDGLNKKIQEVNWLHSHGYSSSSSTSRLHSRITGRRSKPHHLSFDLPAWGRRRMRTAFLSPPLDDAAPVCSKCSKDEPSMDKVILHFNDEGCSSSARKGECSNDKNNHSEFQPSMKEDRTAIPDEVVSQRRYRYVAAQRTLDRKLQKPPSTPGP